MKIKIILLSLYVSIIGFLISSQSASFISEGKASQRAEYASNTSQIQTCIPTPIVEKPTGEGA